MPSVNINQYKKQLLSDFNSRANYDQGIFYAPIAKRLISSADLEKGQKILDVATGTGLVAFSAAQIVGETGKVIAVDISSGMLNHAKQKLANSKLQNLAFLEADVERIHLIDNSFDRILCSLAICYLTDIPAAFRQWHRWLKPGGKVIFNAWSETAFPPSNLFREVAKKYQVKIPNPNELLGTVEKCYKLLSEAGFQSLEIQNEQFGWYYTPDATTAEQMWQKNAQNVFGYQVLQLSPDKLAACKAEYVAAIQALPTTEQGAWCDAQIFFVTACK